MAGRIVASTINNDTGVLATQNGMTGIAKAWVNFTPSTGAVILAFNVSSVTRGGTANYTVNFTTAMANADYVVVGFDQYQRHSANPAATKTTTQWQATNFANDANGAQSDLIVGWFAFFGS
jgi:hypothetical protein